MNEAKKQLLADLNHAAALATEIRDRFEDLALSACACMGAVYGEPHCPCEMKRRGLPSSPEHLAANAQARKDLEALFGPGGAFHNPPPAK